MIRALAVVTVLAATAHTASAGVYGSLGLGNTGVETTDFNAREDSRSLRLAGGYEFTKYLSAEAGFMAYGVGLNSAQYDGREFYAAGLVHVPIADGFWGFARLGAQHTALTTSDNGPGLAGNGYLYGAGFEYRLKLPQIPVPHLGVWVDYTRNNATLTNQSRTNQTSDVGTSMWSLGVTVGL